MSNTKAICFETTLGEISTFEKSYTFSRAIEGEGEVKHIHYGDIHTKLPNVINEANILPTITQQDEFQFVNYGDIIIADASEDYKDLGKAVCYLDQEEKKVISGLHTHRLKVDKSKVVPEYLINLFQTSRYRKFVWKMGTGVSVLGLSKSNLSKYPVTLPNIETQRNIGFFFGRLNKKIQLQQEKINSLKEQKKGYMQKLFKQEVRFKDDDDAEYPKWRKKVKAAELFEAISNKNSEEKIPVLSATQDQGMVLRDLLNKDMQYSTTNLNSYKIVDIDDFVISLRSFQGGIELSHLKGLVSPAYTIFRKKNDNVYNDYFKYLFKTETFINQLKTATYGIRDGKSISYKDFSTLKFDLPSYAEQRKIVGFLSKLDEKIQIEEQQLDCLQEQKKGFMQQMFI
ncbi:restriction endonuclease subunit S [Bacillus cereus]|uniref:restriction endonuclease subunit S n=1 Tax=Bacillus cereus TaxID=1396 RepID=UPI002AC26F41|nr:restriction endonuclease subunit S [Bacillus cereus]MDZ4545018.1 restriction endonuclease subunit S [Bacillus cereus]